MNGPTVASIPLVEDSQFICRVCGAPLQRATGSSPHGKRMRCPTEGCAQLLEGFRSPTFLAHRSEGGPKEQPAYHDSPFAKPHFRPPWPWIVGRTFSHIRRHVNVHAVSVASILIATVLAFAPSWGHASWEDILYLIGAVLLIVVSVPIVAWFSLRAVSPKDYAQLVLEGRRVDRQFRWVAWSMCRLCRRFTRRRCVRKLDDMNSLLIVEVQKQIQRRERESARTRTEQILRYLEQRFKKELRSSWKYVRKLERLLEGSHVQIERATRLKELLAENWGIDRRRLCDHVFRFSPSLFETRAWKLVVNWQTLQDGLIKRYIPLDRAFDLLRENERIFRRLDRRANYLCLLTNSRFLFKWVAVFASRSSVRTSLIAYSSAIAEVARRMDPKNGDRRRKGRRWWRRLGSEPLERNRARLVALHHMQRAHPGVDLHRTLVTMCTRGQEWCRAQIALREEAGSADAGEGDTVQEASGERPRSSIENFQTRYQLWEWRRRALQELLDEVAPGDEAARSSYFDGEDRKTLEQTTKALAGLPESVVTAIHASQWEINNHFGAVFERERETGKKALVVLLGYSHVLRDVVKTVLWNKLEASDRVFVVRLGHEDFGSRLMDFELREDREWYRPGQSPEFGVGDGELLESLYKDQEDWHVYVLLDGDCFDLRRHVVQGADKREKLRQLERWTDGRSTTFLIAEGFKIYDDLTTVPDFFRDDLDAISLVESSSSRVVVVGDSFVRHLNVP